MRQFRLEDRSVYYWLVNKYSGTPIKIVDGQPEGEVTNPEIGFEWDRVIASDLEMGNRQKLRQRTWYFDVYATTKDQRDELVDDLLDSLEDNIPVYDYNAGFPPTVVSQLGSLEATELDADNIPINPDMVEKMYYRAQVRLLATYTKF